MVGRGDADRLVVVNSTMLQTIPSLRHFQASSTCSAGQLVLLVGLVVHEDEMVGLAVEELGLDLLDVGGIERVAALVGAVEHRAAEQVPQLALVERLALAGLDEIALDHHVGIAVRSGLSVPYGTRWCCSLPRLFFPFRFL